MARDQFDGRVTAIRGAVVDHVFEDRPPPIDDAVQIVDSEGRIVIAEVRLSSTPAPRARSRSSRRRD
jgi:hypothetical protein